MRLQRRPVRALTRGAVAVAALWSLACGTTERTGSPASAGAGGSCALAGACGGAAGSAGETTPAAGGPWLMLPDAGSDSGESGCVREKVHFERELPNVMLVVDGSGSMIIPDFNDDTRWEAVKNALIEADSGLVAKLDSQIRFGLSMYFSSPPAGEPDTGCPVLEGVPIALDNLGPISERLKRASPHGATPTGESLERVWPELANLDPALRGPKIIVLATDGEPTTCAGAREQSEGRALSRTAVENAFAAGIRTFVIAVGRELGDDHLRELANLGQGHPATDTEDRFYRVLDTSELEAALFSIGAAVQECLFELHGTVREESARLGTVTLDGTPLVYQAADGWHLTGPSELSIDGAACEAIQSGAEATLDISFPCGDFTPR